MGEGKGNGENGELPEFQAESAPPENPSERAVKELEQFGRGDPKPNTVVLKLWGGGHISFNPENSVSLFALLSLVLVLLCALIVTLLGIWVGETSWMDRLVTALGHAATAIVGAIVGSAVTKKD